MMDPDSIYEKHIESSSVVWKPVDMKQTSQLFSHKPEPGYMDKKRQG
jgi:hypothetical protein